MNHEEYVPHGKHRSSRRLPWFLLFVGILSLGLLGGWLWSVTRPLPGANVQLPDYVTAELLPQNRWSRPGIALEEINGIVLHYVGNPGDRKSVV